MRYSYWFGIFVKDEDELCDASYKEVLYIPNGSVIDLKWIGVKKWLLFYFLCL